MPPPLSASEAVTCSVGGLDPNMVSLSQKLRSKQPLRIYYAGSARGVDIDHVPPRGLFDGKWRPKGGEVTTCKQCHEGTREMDDVAAFATASCPTRRRLNSMTTSSGRSNRCAETIPA